MLFICYGKESRQRGYLTSESLDFFRFVRLLILMKTCHLFVFSCIPLWDNMNPKNFPPPTLNTHFSGLSQMCVFGFRRIFILDLEHGTQLHWTWPPYQQHITPCFFQLDLWKSCPLNDGINFRKSSLYGINIDPSFLTVVGTFLHCKVGSLLLNFLGLLVGAIPRFIKTWNPVVEKFKKRLSIWKGRHLSISGRLVLINSILSSLPLFYFSIYKAPKKVLETFSGTQRRFLL